MPRFLAVLFLALFLSSPALRAQEALPSHKEYAPAGGAAGRVVVLVSGQTGAGNYDELASGLAKEGFDVVLVDGNDFWGKGVAGGSRLRAILEEAAKSSHALPGKAGVVGASLGGATALTYATRMPQHVGAVVVLYPLTSFIKDPADFVAKIKVPTLMMAGTFDSYKGCCTIEMARKLGEAAKAGDATPFELVEFPGVDHGFSTDNGKRRDVAADALRRTAAFLRQQLGG